MAFITQRGETWEQSPRVQKRIASTVERQRETSELEALVSGVNSVSQATLLLKKMKESREVDDALDYMKEQFSRRMAACNERQRAFEGKQAEMRQQVAKFEKFISENDAKRDRAEAKTKAERAAYRVKCREQEKLEAELAAEETEREALASRLDRVRRYQAYLERTVDVAEDADEVWDLLHRYQTLRSANKDLMGQVQAGQGAIDEMRSDLQATTSAHTNAVLVQNSQVHADQQAVEALRLGNKGRADANERLEEESKAATKQTGQVLLAIRNVYLRCASTMTAKVALLPEVRLGADAHELAEGIDGALKLITERLTDLHDVEAGFPAWEARREQAEQRRREEAEAARLLNVAAVAK